MEIIKNTDYFENLLLSELQGSNNTAANQLLSDMVTYARSIEIPPGESLEHNPKPDGTQSVYFRAQIELLLNSISSTLLSLFQEFLTYIESLENSLP